MKQVDDTKVESHWRDHGVLGHSWKLQPFFEKYKFSIFLYTIGASREPNSRRSSVCSSVN